MRCSRCAERPLGDRRAAGAGKAADEGHSFLRESELLAQADALSVPHDRLRLLFFGNLHQDWTEFVLSDLGLFRYEQVEFSSASRGFAGTDAAICAKGWAILARRG